MQDLFLAYSTVTRKPGVVKHDDKPLYHISEHQELIMKDLLVLLVDLKLATDIWEGDSYVSISIVYSILFNIVKKLQLTPCETEEGTAFKNILLDNLKFRFSMSDNEYLSTMSVHVFASFLDPRFKDFVVFE